MVMKKMMKLLPRGGGDGDDVLILVRRFSSLVSHVFGWRNVRATAEATAMLTDRPRSFSYHVVRHITNVLVVFQKQRKMLTDIDELARRISDKNLFLG